jgi:hypothetical protein
MHGKKSRRCCHTVIRFVSTSDKFGVITGTTQNGILKGAQEIFDRLDFHDFYTIKPFWVGDFGSKI